MQTTDLAYSVPWCHFSSESNELRCSLRVHSDTVALCMFLKFGSSDLRGWYATHPQHCCCTAHRWRGCLIRITSQYFFQRDSLEIGIFIRYGTDQVSWCLLANYWGAIRCCTAYCICDFSSDCDNQSTSQLELLTLRKNNGSININAPSYIFNG